MLCVLLFMAFIPGLNALFQLMNASYYARWFYMLTLMMAAATMMALENPRVDWRRSLKWTTLITLAMTLVIGLMPTLTKTDGEITDVTFGLEKYPTRFWTYAAIALLSLALVGFVLAFYNRGSRPFYRAASVCLSITIVLYSVFFIALGKTQSDYTYDHIIPYALNGGADVAIDDLRVTTSVRISTKASITPPCSGRYSPFRRSTASSPARSWSSTIPSACSAMSLLARIPLTTACED